MLATLTSKGQLTLSKAARDALGLKTGQRFEVDVSDAGDLNGVYSMGVKARHWSQAYAYAALRYRAADEAAAAMQ